MCSINNLIASDCSLQFASRKIQQLADELPMHSLPLQDTLIVIPEILPDKALVFAYNDSNELAHIGVSLFTDETKQLLDKKICDFLERYWLELLLQNHVEGVKRKLQEYHVNLLIDGTKFGTVSAQSITQILHNIKMPVCFFLQNHGQRAEAVWSFENHTITLDFPLYRELIDGTDKKEADIELYQQLQQSASHSYQLQEEPVEESELTRKEKDIYVRQGTVFMIPTLSSDRYYTPSSQDSFVPVFQYEYPVYSMNNLFLTYEHGRNTQLLLTHRQYGHFTPEISLPLLDFLIQFKDDFEPACHTALTAKGELETIVVFFHKTLNYIHLLKVRISRKDLFSPHPVLKADFYSNIPQHYINSLLR